MGVPAVILLLGGLLLPGGQAGAGASLLVLPLQRTRRLLPSLHPTQVLAANQIESTGSARWTSIGRGSSSPGARCAPSG